MIVRNFRKSQKKVLARKASAFKSTHLKCTVCPESRPSIDKISLFSIPIMVVGSAELDREVRTGHHISHIILKAYFVVSICQLIIM